jgi:phenylpropionate dioxygenase-like ring-hydroxylating dioxygenase large terminal subunit
VVQGQSGRCPGVLQCPYHGWTYNLDGTLKAVASEKTFAKLDKPDLGLKAIELEVFQGFVFVRFDADGPGVAERMAPYAEELAHYRLPDMRPLERVWNDEIEVDWKNVWDNYLEGYHFATGHPGLSDLMGQDYDYEAGPHGTARLSPSIFIPTGWTSSGCCRAVPARPCCAAAAMPCPTSGARCGRRVT